MFNSKVIKTLLFCGAAILCSAGTAQTAFPTKPVRLVVPFPPGGPADIVARVIAQKLGDKWGQPVTVDNKGGGFTVIGAAEVAKAAPDGYTLLLPIDSTLTMNQALFSRLPYDPLKSFKHISIVTTQSLVLLANKQSSATTLAELTSLAKNRPGTINYASGTVASQLAGEVYNRSAGVRMTHVPYKGSSDSTKAMLSGDVQTSFDAIAPNVAYIKEGRFRALATTGLRRTPALPDVPTFHELGFQNYEIRVWLGLSAPAHTPTEITDKIRADVSAILQTAEVKDKFLTLGLEVVGSSSEEFVATIVREQAKYGQLIRELGIKLD